MFIGLRERNRGSIPVTPCKGKSFNFECFCAYRAISFNSYFFLYFIQCLLDIIQDILYILDAY